MSKTIDIFAFTGVKPSKSSQLTLTLFEEGGAVCTGIQKLIQRWMLLFLTPKGSILLDPTRGSTFVQDTLNAGTEADMHSAFIFANADVVAQMAQEEDDTLEFDERIASVSLKNLTLYGGEVCLQIEIQSQAGSSRVVTIPIHSNPVVL